jgi:hypothetical protein
VSYTIVVEAGLVNAKRNVENASKDDTNDGGVNAGEAGTMEKAVKVTGALLALNKEIRSPKLGERKKGPIRLPGYAERRSDLLVAVCEFMSLSTDDLGRSRPPKTASPAQGHCGSLSPRTAPLRSAPAHLPYVGYCQSQAGGCLQPGQQSRSGSETYAD